MADIPVNESTAETVAIATTNGQTAFAFDFLCIWPEQMTVIHERAGVEAVLDYPAQFSVAGLNQENGGTVTLIGVDVLAGDSITMRRVTPIERLNDWQNEGDYKAALVNAEQDKLFMIMQELDRGIKEGDAATDKLGAEVVLLPDGHSGTQKLPDPSPGRVIGYGSDGSFQALINSAAEAEVIAVEVRAARDETVDAKDVVVAAELVAVDAASSASDDADRAELAAGNAFVNANVYADVATGRAAVADGEQFQVLVGDEYVRYERDSASTQTEVGRYPSSSSVQSSVTPKTSRLVRSMANSAYIDPAWLPVMEAMVDSDEDAPYGWWKTGEKIPIGTRTKDVITNWSPAALSDAGFVGNWISAMDKAYLFQDYLGTIPVEEYGDPVRLAVCRLVGSPNADRSVPIVNGDFATDLSGWTVPSGSPSVWDDGRAYVVSGSTSGTTGINQSLTGLVIGQRYLVIAEAEVDAGSAAGAIARLSVTTGATDVETINLTSGEGLAAAFFTATATSALLWLTASSGTSAGRAAWFDRVQPIRVLEGDYIADTLANPPTYEEYADGLACIKWASTDNQGFLRSAYAVDTTGKSRFINGILGSRLDDAGFNYYTWTASNRFAIRNGTASSSSPSDALTLTTTPIGESILSSSSGTSNSGLEGLFGVAYWGEDPQVLYRNNATLAVSSSTPGAGSGVTVPWVMYIGGRADRDRLANITVREWFFGSVTRKLNEGERKKALRFVSRDYTPSTDTRVFSIGASSTAEYGGYPKMLDLITSAHTKVSLDVGGSTIASRRSAWAAAANKDTAQWVFIMIGHNDIVTKPTTSDLIDRLQTLVDEVRAVVPVGCKIVLAELTPAKQRYINMLGAIDGETAYQQWLDFNEAIMGNGPTPITGVDYRMDAHRIALDDGNGYLKAEYDIGDGIHYGLVPRQIVADTLVDLLESHGVTV